MALGSEGGVASSPIGVLRYDTTLNNFLCETASGILKVQSIFVNYWYPVKSVSRSFVEMYVDSSFTKTIKIERRYVMHFMSLRKFFKRWLIGEPVGTGDLGDQTN